MKSVCWLCRVVEISFAGRSSLSSWFAWWGLYCLIVCKDCWSIFSKARCVCRVVSRSGTLPLPVSESFWVCLDGKDRCVYRIVSRRGDFVCQWVRCGLLSMSSCVVLTVLEKVSIIEFAYLVRSCVEVWRSSLPQRVTISRFCRVGRVVGSHCLKISEDCRVCLFGKGRFVCRVVLRWGDFVYQWVRVWSLSIWSRSGVRTVLFGKSGWVRLVLWCRDCLPVSEVGWVCLLM